MTAKQNQKTITVAALWQSYWHIILAFVLPFVILGIVYAMYGVYPFGKNSVLVLDLNGQYVSYFEAFRDAILDGKSLLYSHSRSLSGEMLGIVAYYLASPFAFLVVLFPKSHITEALFLMTLLKMACSGLTFAIYLHHKKTKPFVTVVLAVCYALMAYSVVQVMNLMWMDAVLALPLLILGVEELVDRGKYGLFTIILMYLFLTNYYIAYMIGILTFFYFVYYCYLQDKWNRRPIYLFFRQTVIAVLCMSWLLLPTIYSLTLGKSNFSSPNYDLYSKFNFLEFLAKFLPSSYDSVNIEGLPFVYGGMVLLIVVPLYFLNQKIRFRDKLYSCVMLVVLLLCMNISLADLFLHGLQNPNWLNYRYAFFVTFYLLTLGASALEHAEGISRRLVLQVVAGIVVLVLLVQAQAYSFIGNETSIWLALACLFLYAMFYILMHHDPKYHSLKWVLLLLVCCELMINAMTALQSLDREVVYSTRESYIPYMNEIRLPLSKLAYDDPGLYRIEKTFHRTVNDPMSLGMRGLSHSTSTLHAEAITFLKRMGFSARDHWTKYLGATPISDSLLGVRYVLSKEEPIPYYDLSFRLESISAYHNPDAMTLGYAASKAVLDVDMVAKNPFVLQNALLSSLLGQEYTEYFVEVPVKDLVLDNVVHSTIAGHHSYKVINSNENAQLEFILPSQENMPVYAYFPSSYEREVNLWLDHAWLDTYFGNESFRIMKLMGTGLDMSLIMTITQNEVYLKENTPYFYQLDLTAYKQAMERLKQGSWNLERYTESSMKGNVSAQTDGIFFTTLPYEKGWTIRVDGKKVPYYEAAEALIAFDLPAGTHEISMHFMPYGMKEGFILAVLGLGLWFFCKKREQKQTNKAGK